MHHPSVPSEKWTVQREKKVVASDGTVILKVVIFSGNLPFTVLIIFKVTPKFGTIRIPEGALLAQISC